MGRHERELLLATAELLIRGLALSLEGLAHPHERHVETALQHRQGPQQHLLGEIELRGDLSHHIIDSVTPAQATLDDLIQRRRALRRELAEDAPGLPADLASGLGALARHPPGNRHSGDRADALEALLDHRIEHLTRLLGAQHHAANHVLGSRPQRLAETTKILPGLR